MKRTRMKTRGQGVSGLISFSLVFPQQASSVAQLIPVGNSTGSGGYRGLVVGKAGEEMALKVESC